jgi:hypothetical protein
METQRLGGLLIILGLLLVIVASLVFPVSYFTAQYESERAAILAANRTGWAVANWLWIAGGAAAAAGMLLVALTLRRPLALAGLGLYVIGCAFWVIYAYIRLLEPSFSSEGLWMEAAFGWLTMVALALLGIVFLRTGLPKWVAFVNLGYAALFLVAFVLLRAQMYDYFPPQGVFLVSLPAGAVALKSNFVPQARAILHE